MKNCDRIVNLNAASILYAHSRRFFTTGWNVDPCSDKVCPNVSREGWESMASAAIGVWLCLNQTFASSNDFQIRDHIDILAHFLHGPFCAYKELKEFKGIE